VAQWLRCCATNRKVAGSIPASVSGFFIDAIRSHYGPGVDSASNRNEYQEYFVGERRPVRKADNLPPSCAVVTKSGNLNFLQPPGPLRACNRIALPYLYLWIPGLYKFDAAMTVIYHRLGVPKFLRYLRPRS